MKVPFNVAASLVLLGVAACSSSSEGLGLPDLGGTTPSVDPGGSGVASDVTMTEADGSGTAPSLDTAAGLDPGGAPASDTGGPLNPDRGTAPPADTGSTALEIPDTPAGAKLAWILAIVAGETSPSMSEVDEQFSDAAFAHVTPTRLHDFVYSWRDDTGPWTVVGFEEPARTHSLVVRLQTPAMWRRLLLAVEEEEPFRIKAVALRPAPDLDPEIGGPMPDGLIGLHVYSPWFDGFAKIAPVELVDRATGDPLDPPIDGVTDAVYGYVRLEAPADVEVGVRVDLTNDLSTYTYASRLRAGEDLVLVAAVPSVSVSQYLEAAGLEAEEGKAHLLGFVGHTVDGALFDVENPWQVGCASVALTPPPAAPVLYTSYDQTSFKAMPDPDRSDTNPDNGTFWALNVEPVAHTISATVGEHKATTEVPPLRPGTFTFASLLFDRDEVPANPTPEDCDEPGEAPTE